MVENGHFAPVVPEQPPQRVDVAAFLRENPNPNLYPAFLHLLDNYPQVIPGRKQKRWLLEGGLAIKLHSPERREPHDMDLLINDPEMFEEIKAAREITDIYHPRKPVDWIITRPFNPRKNLESSIDELMDSSTYAYFENKLVWTLERGLLGLSKAVLCNGDEPRPHDIVDLGHLGATKREMMRDAHRLGGIPRSALAHV